MIPHLSERGLLLAPLGRDAELASSLLAEHGVRTLVCAGLGQLVAELRAGAGFAIVTDEALLDADLHALAEWIEGQPEWSDFPFILLTRRGGGIERNPAALRFLETLGNVSFLERPFHPTSLVSLVRAALRGRRRQYEARSRLDALAELNTTLEERIEAAILERLQDQAKLAKTESALHQAQKMEAIGQLTGGIAHDFNNLLMAISSGVYLLGQPMDAVRRRKVMDGIRQSIDRGTTLTRQLLAFSRRRPLAPRVVDLRAQLLGMEEMLHRSLRGDIDVAMSFDEGLWPVELDPSELELAILNVCVNARDAMPGGGTIRITVRNGPGVEGGAGRDAVMLSIADEGTGMSEETRAHAFEPFFTTKDVGRGSGLGLAQVYGFAVQSGGRVSIDSELGRGTTLTFVFPRSGKARMSKAVPREDAETGEDTGVRRRLEQRGQVLLVEDDATVAALTTQMLEDAGIGVTRVGSAREALDALEEAEGIDIVLSDVMMPGMSGAELARTLRVRYPAMPVVLTTGYVEAARAAMAEGFAVLVKPYSFETLVTTLVRQMSRTAAAGR